MDDMNRIVLIVAITVVCVTAIIAGSIAYYHSNVAINAIDKGLVQKTLPGQVGVHWTLPDENDVNSSVRND